MFVKHEFSDFHKQAVAAIFNTVDIGEILSSQHAREKQVNREYLLKVMTTLRFLVRQGLALRRDGDKKDLNFYRLLKFFFVKKILSLNLEWERNN